MAFHESSFSKRQTQPIRSHFHLNLLLKFLLILVIVFITLVAVLSVMFVFPNEHDTLQKTVYNSNSKNFTLLENNVLFFIEDKLTATKFKPIFCQLSKNQNMNIHVITLSKNIFHENPKKCNVISHSLDNYRGSFEDKVDSLSLVFQGINNILNKVHPDVFIYSKNLESLVVRGVDAALSANSDLLKFTTIRIPLDELDHLTWIADLSIESLKNWNIPKFHLQVITQDRPDSLSRLIRSLKSSYFMGDDILLTINMDRGADLVTIEYCRTLEWNFGRKNIRHRIVQGGLMAAIVESYYPVDDNDYAVLLEDDIELSPYFYIWAKYNVLKYRYGAERSSSGRLFGVSLYSGKVNELFIPGRKPFDPQQILEGTNYPPHTPYLSQIPCSWGAVYFPEIWREFHDYFTFRLRDVHGLGVQNISIPETRSNFWNNSWKRYFIELAYLRGYVMIYPNYENFISFSTNHAEAGTHIRLEQGELYPTGVFDVPLMFEDNILAGLPDYKLPNYSAFPSMDLTGNLVTIEELVQRGLSLHLEVSKCPPNEELLYIPYDMLCLDEETKQNATDRLLEEKLQKDKISNAVKLIYNSNITDAINLEPNDIYVAVSKYLKEKSSSDTSATSDIGQASINLDVENVNNSKLSII